MIYEIQGSASEPYKVDTEKMTCTCPQYKFRCSHYPTTSESHYCKHLQQVLEEHPEHAPAWYQARFLMKTSNEVEVSDLDGKTRYPRVFFDTYVYELKSVLNRFKMIERYEFCGSYRRRAERCSDLDVLLQLSPGSSVSTLFDYLESVMNYELIQNIGRGELKGAYMIDGLVHVDFKVIRKDSWPFATLHFTGSKAHNIKMRQKALSMGYSLSEYGFKTSNSDEYQYFDCKSEEDIFKFLNLQYLEPWDRNI